MIVIGLRPSNAFYPTANKLLTTTDPLKTKTNTKKKKNKKKTDRLVLFICVRRSLALFYDEYEFVVVHEFAYIFKVYYIWVAIAPT